MPLLRAPPFPDAPLPRANAAPAAGRSVNAARADQRDAIFSALRDARVGGTFWGRSWAEKSGHETTAARPRILVRSTDPAMASNALALCPDDAVLHVSPTCEDVTIDPWSILPGATRLIADGDDEWVALGAVLGLSVEVLSPGRFGQPGDTQETLAQFAQEALTAPMHNPFDDGWLGPLEAIALLSDWRRVIDGNRGCEGERIVAACGMSWWKRDEIRRFLWSPGSPLKIHRSASRALDHAAHNGGALAIWPSRVSPELERKAQHKGVAMVRVEDGFVRSVGLGSNLVPPLSVIVDRKGIHYDPSSPSDLETILAHTQFSRDILDRAARLRASIVDAGISKYAARAPTTLAQAQRATRQRQGRSRVILVPGQVEDDMSVLAGGGGISSNLELLRRARALEPDAEIWWRPHPDVDAGHRKGAVDDAAASAFADRIQRDGAMSDLLNEVDALHTLTSLSGFEALLRGCEVICHGVPFYSGWGLTSDLGDVPPRRGRVLSLDELVAGVLLLYPRYLDPVTGLPCPPEILVQRLMQDKVDNRLGWIEPLRRGQGHMMRRLRSLFAR